jgi:hypothetical protein
LLGSSLGVERERGRRGEECEYYDSHDSFSK